MNKPLVSFAAVLTACATLALRAQMPVQDDGVAGAWQKLRKLQTTASVSTPQHIQTTSMAASWRG